MLTVVTYHYVRPMPGHGGFRMHGRTPAEFEAQLDAIERSHTLIRLPQLLEYVHGGAPLPARAALLTFDDGLVDHAQWVTPALRRRGLSGVFFVTADAVAARRVLPAHQIHHLLGGGRAPTVLLAELFSELNELRTGQPEIPDEISLRQAHERIGEWDDSATMCFKRLLQRELPEDVRRSVLDRMFSRHVSADPVDFARQLYLDVAAIRSMADDGMTFGGHGVSHRWLSRLDTQTQRAEIMGSRALLQEVLGAMPGGWSFSYPYGGYTETSVRLLAEAGCNAAFTVLRTASENPADDPLRIPRLDTNDLPFQSPDD